MWAGQARASTPAMQGLVKALPWGILDSARHYQGTQQSCSKKFVDISINYVRHGQIQFACEVKKKIDTALISDNMFITTRRQHAVGSRAA